MKLTLSFTINLTRKGKPAPVEHHPAGDNFAATELADQGTTPELQMGFQRNVD